MVLGIEFRSICYKQLDDLLMAHERSQVQRSITVAVGRINISIIGKKFFDEPQLPP